MDEKDKQMAAIRQSLTQYVGAFLTHTAYQGEEARQIIAAILCEEALGVCTQPELSMFASKPVLRAAIFILSRIREQYESVNASELIKSIDATILVLRRLTEGGNTDGNKGKGT